jgi:hypothetical protein
MSPSIQRLSEPDRILNILNFNFHNLASTVFVCMVFIHTIIITV